VVNVSTKHVVLAAQAVIALVSGCGGHRATGTAEIAVDGSKPIDDRRFVRIGGIEQWITIKGSRRDNPIVLFLHGGPGLAATPYADQVFGDWLAHFTVVQWDQRGAGRTYARTGPSIESTMTIDRMVQDGIEVTQFVERHLGQNKIILLGGSWGSILGVLMVKARPELYCAYVGTAQVVGMKQNLAASYPRVLEMARAAGDTEVIDALTAIGPPPWASARAVVTALRSAGHLEAKTIAPFITRISPEYASERERVDREAAANLNFIHFLGETLSGPLMAVDLPALGTRFEVPVVIVHGAKDLKTTPEVTRAYFDRIEAPYKQLLLEPDTGHELSRASTDLMRKVLDETVAPLCRRR
jgi:pimeloyl-ACP methyl ester carboxylesterase